MSTNTARIGIHPPPLEQKCQHGTSLPQLTECGCEERVNLPLLSPHLMHRYLSIQET